MSTVKRITKYCLLALIAAAVYYYALTTEGYGKVYELLIQMNSADIEEINEFLEDEETADLLATAKMILVAKTNHNEGDLIIAEQVAELADHIKHADMWVEQIPNSEAEMLNRYLKTANEAYLDEALYQTINEENENYKKIAERLYESSIISNKYYQYAGISKENSIEQQVNHIKMLIDAAKNNSIHENIKSILRNTNASDEEFLETIAASLKENPSMYKEHFLTEYAKLTAAIRAYEAYQNQDTSLADEFCTLYRKNPTSTFVAFIQGEDIADFIDNIEKQTAIFTKRRMIIEAFDYTENESEAIKVRIVDSEKMQYADAYGKFVYSLSGKEFKPTTRETERYYIRIENIKS